MDLDMTWLSQEIPISFTRNGKAYNGYFSFVYGTGAITFHLYVDRNRWGQFGHWYYGGKLFIRNNSGRDWAFYSSEPGDEMTDLSDFMGAYVLAYLE